MHAFLIYNSSLLLKSSFVEAVSLTNPTEWLTLWNKKHFWSKTQLSLNHLFSSSAVQVRNLPIPVAFRSKTIKLLRSNLKQLSTSNKKSDFLSRRYANNTRRNLTFILKYKARLRKIKTAQVLEFFNHYYSSILSDILSQFIFKVKEFKSYSVTLGLRFLNSFNILNPQFLARFIARRVSYGFQLTRVIRPVMKDLTRMMASRKYKLTGFRIACSGRFDRKQIATYAWQKAGPVSLNNFSANINYGVATAFLKYGTCGIKVWLASKHQVLKSQLAVRSINKEFNSLGVVDFLNEKHLKGGENLQQSDFWFLVYAFRLLTVYLNSEKSEQFLKSKLAWSYISQLFSSTTKEHFVLAKRLQLLSTQWLRYENYRLSSMAKITNFGSSKSIASTRRKLNKIESSRATKLL